MRLLAKSVPRDTEEGNLDDAISLPGHLQSSYDAASAIVESTGEDQLKALGLQTDDWTDRFSRVVCLAAALHDLGKANNHFQGIVQEMPGRRGRLQGLRHEWVALLIFSEPAMCAWLNAAFALSSADRLAFECAVSGHHPAYGRPSPPQQPFDGSGSEMEIYVQHPDFIRSLNFASNTFGLGEAPILRQRSLSLLGDPDGAFERIKRICIKEEETWQVMGIEERQFIAAVKACLIAADAAGSILPRKITDQENRTAWIRSAFSAIPTPEQIGEIVQSGLAGNDLRRFQKAVAEEAGEVTFVKAGCGTGKTLAAYHWARTRCQGRRLYFCYPTTGTATEGYRDYLFDAASGSGRFGAELFHGRAKVDLDIILSVDRDLGSDFAAGNENENFVRIESLNAWSTPIVSCTVDTVLGLVQNHRRGLYSWPALAGAAFVFDEIHAYDQRLFAALLRFLEYVRGVTVLLMTASLSNKRLEAIRKSLAKRGALLSMPRRSDDLRALEELPRYRWSGKLENQDPLPQVLAETRNGGKTLWVCNTVDRAMDASAQAEAAGLNPLIYHSRFRYEDRVRRHKTLIDAFRKGAPALAICTQVAEMSLNLSATLLVTDLAPVPALIQRLGRLNRHARPGDPVRPFLVLEPVGQDGKPFLAPYDQATYGNWAAASRKWLALLPTNSITQADLAATWEGLQQDTDEPMTDKSAWLSGGPITIMQELRKGTPGLTVIMERDGMEIKAGRKSLVEVALPMPPPPSILQWKTWTQHNGIPLAPEGTIVYDEKRGAKWQKTRE